MRHIFILDEVLQNVILDCKGIQYIIPIANRLVQNNATYKYKITTVFEKYKC